MPSKMLTAREAAELLGVPLRTFYDFRLPCFRYGPRCTRWATEDLDAFKESCRIKPRKTRSQVTAKTITLRTVATDLRASFARAGVPIGRR